MPQLLSPCTAMETQCSHKKKKKKKTKEETGPWSQSAWGHLNRTGPTAACVLQGWRNKPGAPSLGVCPLSLCQPGCQAHGFDPSAKILRGSYSLQDRASFVPLWPDCPQPFAQRGGCKRMCLHGQGRYVWGKVLSGSSALGNLDRKAVPLRPSGSLLLQQLSCPNSRSGMSS